MGWVVVFTRARGALGARAAAGRRGSKTEKRDKPSVARWVGHAAAGAPVPPIALEGREGTGGVQLELDREAARPTRPVGVRGAGARVCWGLGAGR